MTNAGRGLDTAWPSPTRKVPEPCGVARERAARYHLGRQNAVDGIAMWPGQRPSGPTVLQADGRPLEVLFG